MSAEFLRKVGIALVALLVVWLGARLLRGSGRDSSQPFTPAKLDKNAVDAITITHASDTVLLAKRGAAWTVNGYPAAKGSPDDLLAALADTAARGEVVAENATSHASLGVDSANAHKVVARQGDRTLLTYLVGKRGPNYESSYLRLPGQAVVYQVKGRLVEFAEKKVDDWRDKQIVAVEPDSLTGVEVQRGKASYSLAKTGKEWKVNGGAVDSMAVASLLGQFRRLEASGFASRAQMDSASFSPADRTVKLVGSGGKALATLAFDSTANGFWVKRDTVSTIYRIDQYTGNQLAPADSTLKKKEPKKK
jgi:hypothetical protein